MNNFKIFVYGISVACILLLSCNKSNKAKQTYREKPKDTVILVVPNAMSNNTDSVVTGEFSRLLRYSYPWFPETKIGHYKKAIPNLGPKGETTVYVCIGDEMYDDRADGIFLLTNSEWDRPNPDYSKERDCLVLGPEVLGDSNEEGIFEYRMTYDIHDSILTIKVQDTKLDDYTGIDSLVGSMTISHTYSIRYWTFRYLSSDTVLYGDTKFLNSLVDPRKAHLGYKISDPMNVYNNMDDSLFNDPRWAYAEEKLWGPEVCAFLCDLAGIADGWLGETLDIVLFESMHNNPETNHCMAEYLTNLPASEQEVLLQCLLYTMGMSIYDYTAPENEQLIYPDFDSFMNAFPVFNSPYNTKVRQLYTSWSEK